jgi:hypothetical protein
MADWTDELQVFCADVGSIARNNFGWARRIAADTDEVEHVPSSIESFADAVAAELLSDRPVALGFEMPLFVPVPDESSELGRARPSDINAPAWSSGIGGSVMATGLVQAAWVLERLHDAVPGLPAHTRWETFEVARRGMLIWEAFVTRDAKGSTHEEDAVIGVRAFCDQLPTPGDANADDTPRPLSLAAAAAVWAGWQVPTEALRQPCVLVRA